MSIVCNSNEKWLSVQHIIIEAVCKLQTSQRPSSQSSYKSDEKTDSIWLEYGQ